MRLIANNQLCKEMIVALALHLGLQIRVGLPNTRNGHLKPP